jgi:uncharacterized protein (DUF58 family)
MRSRLSSLCQRLPLTREGLGWLVLTVAILVTRLVKGINLITLLACMFLAVGVVNLFLAWRQVRGLRIERNVPDFLVAGQSTSWSLTVIQSPTRDRSGLTLVENWPDKPATWIVDLDAVASRTFEVAIEPAHRGVVHLGPALVRSSYPFGLALFERAASPPAAVFVAPRLGRLERGVLRRWLSLRQTSTSAVRSRPIRHPTGQMEFHGLRAFRSGDSPRHIHWRTSARRGELMVREFEEYPNDDLVLIVDLSLRSLDRIEAFERMLSLAATIVWEWCRQKGDWLSVVLVGATTQRFSGATSAALRADVMRALAEAQPRADTAVAAALDRHVASTTARVLLSVGASALVDPLSESAGHVLATVDLTAGDDADFFVPESLDGEPPLPVS